MATGCFSLHLHQSEYAHICITGGIFIFIIQGSVSRSEGENQCTKVCTEVREAETAHKHDLSPIISLA